MYTILKKLINADAWIMLDSPILRGMLAALTAFLVVMALGRPVIDYLRRLKFGQAVRDDGPKTHLRKNGTPTMGGVMILMAIFLAALLWCDLSNSYILILLTVMGIFGTVGWRDDWLKIKHKNPKGLSAGKKYFGLSVGALIAGGWLLFIAGKDLNHAREMTNLLVPLFKNREIPLSSVPLGLGFLAFTYLVINGTSNAVNLTDGLDGLVAFPVVLAAAGLAVFAYVSGNQEFAQYLNVPYLAQNTEVTVFCAAMMGACMGFLWYNAAPAEVFMGDVGALPLGGLLGTIAVMTRQELAFALIGGVFVIEAVSVIAQVGSYKLRKKRVILMAPLHHHFEEKGWPETKVVARFWIIAIFCLVLGLMTLKLR